MTKKAAKGVVVSEQQTEVSVFIQQAIDKGLPVETMERLFALREKVNAEEARNAFHKAIAEFQNACPEVQKTKKVMNNDGQSVRYQYAPLDEIIKQIKKPLMNAGLSYSWNVKNDPEMIEATVKITHTLGHSETSSFQIPIDKGGYMTAPQKYASALTFAKRYTLVNALGISTGEEDTDATDVGKEPAPKSEKAKIVFLLKTLGQPHKSKAEIEKSIIALTKLEAIDGNLVEIVSRLEILVQEKNDDSSTIS